MHKHWRALLRVGFSGILVAVLLTQIDLSAVMGLVSRVEPGALLVAVAFGVGAAFAAALAWKVLLDAQGVRLGAPQVFATYLVGLFFSAFTPAGLGGDVARTVRVHQQTRQGVQGGASVVASRALSLFSLMLVVALMGLGRAAPMERQIAMACLVALVLACVAVIALEKPILAVLGHFAQHRSIGLVRDGAVAVYAFKRAPLSLLAATLLLVTYQFLGVMPVYVLARGMGIELALTDAVTLGLIGRLTAFMPISISGIGVQEGAFVVLFGLVGVGAAQALAISLLDHVVLTVVPLIGGVVFALDADMRGADMRHAPAAEPHARPTAAARIDTPVESQP